MGGRTFQPAQLSSCLMATQQGQGLLSLQSIGLRLADFNWGSAVGSGLWWGANQRPNGTLKPKFSISTLPGMGGNAPVISPATQDGHSPPDSGVISLPSLPGKGAPVKVTCTPSPQEGALALDLP